VEIKVNFYNIELIETPQAIIEAIPSINNIVVVGLTSLASC